MSAWALAWRTVAHNPARAVLAVSGVAVIGALLFNMLLLSRGLLVSFRDLLDAAGYDVRVLAAQGSMVHREPIAGAAALAGAIGQLTAVQRVALVRTDSAVATVPGRQTRGVAVTFVGSTENAIGGVWDIVKGSSLPLVSAAGFTGIVDEAARARLAAVVECSADAILSIGLDGLINTWNPGAERIFGYTAAEAIGKESKGNAPDGENDKESGLQPAELCIRRAEIVAQKRNERDHGLPRGEVDKIDQSKYSKEANLLGIERNGLR